MFGAVPQVVFGAGASGKEYGQPCANNSDCASGDCEEASDDNYYCDCGGSILNTADEQIYCKKIFEATYPGHTWECKDGIPGSKDLDYCLANDGEKVFPLDYEKFVDLHVEEKPAPPTHAATLDEIQEMLRKPVPRITIPGLKFSNPDIKDFVTVHTDGKTYINIPYLGQYISAIYRYGMITISILAVVMLVRSGLQWVMKGSSSEGRSEIIKGMLNAIIGLLLAVGSYTILYFVNPELVRFKSLRILYINSVPIPEITEETVDTDLEADRTIAEPIADVTTVDETYFLEDDINSQQTDGWTVWSALGEEEKKQVLPHLFKQVAPSCPEGHLVKITDITEWNGKLIHPALLESFKEVNKLAGELGFKLAPGSTHRPASTMVPLWNTGVVARYKQGRKDWEINERKIAKPSCQTGHSMGAAVDANLVHIKTGKKLMASDPGTINQSNYKKKFLEDPYKIILEQIFYQNGWVRYCLEHWHFEYKVTPNAQKWDGKSRCVGFTVDETIPNDMKKQVNEIVGSNFLN